MPAKYDKLSDSYHCWGQWHKREEVLKHFGALSETAAELDRMFAEAYRRYYSNGGPSSSQMHERRNAYLRNQELPNTVVALFCRERGLAPEHSAA